MITQTLEIAVTKKDGVIQKIGQGAILEPRTNFSGKPMRWYEDKPKTTKEK